MERLCTICDENTLVSELERMSGICDACDADIIRSAEAFAEQDFDETLAMQGTYRGDTSDGDW